MVEVQGGGKGCVMEPCREEIQNRLTDEGLYARLILDTRYLNADHGLLFL